MSDVVRRPILLQFMTEIRAATKQLFLLHFKTDAQELLFFKALLDMERNPTPFWRHF